MIRACRQGFLVALAISGLAGAAQAGEHVDWLDDGIDSRHAIAPTWTAP